MSNSSAALVGAAGMNARNRGLSHEITAGASTSAKSAQHLRRVVAARAEQLAGPRLQLVAGHRVSSGTGSSRSRQLGVLEDRLGDAIGELVVLVQGCPGRLARRVETAHQVLATPYHRKPPLGVV